MARGSEAGTGPLNQEGSMSVWYEGQGEIACTLDRVAQAIDNHIGKYFTGVVSHMPGLTNVDLVEERPDAVVIRTNEG